MNRDIQFIFILVVVITTSSAPYIVQAAHEAASTQISLEDAEAIRSLLVDMANDLSSNMTDLETLNVESLWPELLDNSTNSSVPGAIQRLYQTVDINSDFPSDMPSLNLTQTPVDIATLGVLNSLFNVISGSINIGSGGIGVMAATLGLDANAISRFFSRAGFVLNVDNFGLTLVKDSGKWAASKTTAAVLSSDPSSAWTAALKDLGLNTNLKSQIQSTIKQVKDVIKQFESLAASKL